jgi:tRNA A-37 threonylcarbamoyl transferase component Bud32
MDGEIIAGRYELEELVGRGGMSTVYRAHDRLLERTVALKLLHERHLGDRESVERFRREAEAAAALSHPNVVTVIDRGEDEGRHFIVFEYVDGENLKQRVLREGPLPVREALELTLQTARALAYAHAEGLVHRDVKPQNVLLTDGRAKVTDFGIARSLDVARGITQTGTVMGTSEYLSPEQARGEQVDERTDVYSLGIVLYELLTGETPFRGENFVTVALKHLNEPPPSVRERRGDVALRLELALDRALAKEPDARFGSMADFCTELEACLREPPGGETVVPRSSRRRRPRRRTALLLLTAALVAALAALAAVLVLRGGGGPGGGAADGSSPVPLSGVGAYDPPPGDGREHDEDAPSATDGDPATYWTTESYHSPFAELGKRGVGLVLDAGGAARVRRIELTTDTPGFSAVIEAGDSRSCCFRAVSDTQTVGRVATFDLHATTARYYVVWISELPPGLRAHVNEVRALQ